jgi:hypothetical protein
VVLGAIEQSELSVIQESMAHYTNRPMDFRISHRTPIVVANFHFRFRREQSENRGPKTAITVKGFGGSPDMAK